MGIKESECNADCAGVYTMCAIIKLPLMQHSLSLDAARMVLVSRRQQPKASFMDVARQKAANMNRKDVRRVQTNTIRQTVGSLYPMGNCLAAS